MKRFEILAPLMAAVLFVVLVGSAGAQPPGPPGGRGGRGGPPPGGPGFGPGPGGQVAFESSTQPKDDDEAKILKAIEDIVQNQGRRMNVPAADGRLLRTFAESLDAKRVVEIGTSNGISAIWMAIALRKTDGHLITHEIDPNTAALARENFAAAGVADRITVVEGDAHEKVTELKGPIDLVFIDADKEGYLDYFEKLLPLVRPGGIICAHNMNARQADPAFVKAITTNREVETLFYMQGGGMSVSMKKR
jgi:caffeoyl-CoA O-methyltransferase